MIHDRRWFLQAFISDSQKEHRRRKSKMNYPDLKRIPDDVHDEDKLGSTDRLLSKMIEAEKIADLLQYTDLFEVFKTSNLESESSSGSPKGPSERVTLPKEKKIFKLGFTIRRMEINRYGVAEDLRMAGRSKRLRAHTDDEVHSPRQGDIDGEAENMWMHTETSPEHWTRVEEELQTTNMVVAFAMTETEVEVGRCTWSLRHFTARILERCAQSGIEFAQNRLQSKKGGRMLTGVPVELNRDVWLLLKRGYLTLGVGDPSATSCSVRILVRPDYTGKEKSNLTLNEVEYQNCNELQPAELVAMVAAHSNPVTYAFRLFFISPAEANTVYGNYLKATTPRVCRYGNPVDTAELKMVANVDWDGRHSRLYRTGTDVDNNMCKLMILGLRNEVTHDQL
ncbi:hypothetical protein KRP22_002146 [Phytophthora ramorum]|nr:hypothetical protein KRP22_1429 [Phytophthora ramorum]